MTSGFDALRRAAGDYSTHEVSFERDDTDSFALRIDKLYSGTSINFTLTKRDVIPLLPTGSHWSQASGWRSFFGVPCRFGDSLTLALGLIRVENHDTRGAYPVSRIFFLEFDARELVGVFERLLALMDAGGSEGLEGSPRYGAIRGRAHNPEGHRETERLILNGAGEAYRNGTQLMFRTAVLSEHEIPRLRFLSLFNSSDADGSPLEYGPSLYGTVPSVYNNFSWTSKLKVLLEYDLTF